MEFLGNVELCLGEVTEIQHHEKVLAMVVVMMIMF